MPETTASELTVDIPGAFTEWFEDSGVMQDTDDKLDDASRALREAYKNSKAIHRGRSFTIRLTTTDPEALRVLGEYADTVVQGGRAMDFDPSEVRAARVIVGRVLDAVRPVYEARYPKGAKVAIAGLDAICTITRVSVDLTYSRILVAADGPGGVGHVVDDTEVTLQPEA